MNSSVATIVKPGKSQSLSRVAWKPVRRLQSPLSFKGVHTWCMLPENLFHPNSHHTRCYKYALKF